MNENTSLLLLAQNPNAPYQSLEELALQDDNEAIQKALVLNPSTPFSILMQLGVKYPALLFENQVFPLLLLEDPTLSSIPPETLVGLAKLPQFPPGVLASLAHHESYDVRSAVAANASTPPEALIYLLEDADLAYEHLIEGNPSTPKEYLLLFQRARRLITGVCKWVDGKRVQEKSEEEALSLEEMQLLFSRGTNSNMWLAQSPQLPCWMMKELANSPEVSIRAALCSNPSLTPELIDCLADDVYFVVSRLVHHPNLTLTAVSKFARHKLTDLKASLALRKTLPVEVLESLAGDPSSRVRENVATVKELPACLAWKLAQDADVGVREHLAMNQSASRESLTLLAGDSEREVRQNVLKNPTAPRNFLEIMVRAGASANLRQRAMPDVTLSPQELEELSKSGPFACSLVALHPNTSEETRHYLMKQDFATRCWVARSPFTSEKILREISTDLDDELRFWVAENTRCPLNVLERLAFDPCAGVRKAVAANPRTPLSLVGLLSQDASLFVRYGVSQHPTAGQAPR